MKFTNFEDYLESEYEHVTSEFFECNGGHLWHIDDIKKEYYQNIRTKVFNYDEMLRKCGVEL